jgi:NAD-dependent DNA ligase
MSIKGVGRRTIEILLHNSLKNLEEVERKREKSLIEFGIGKKQAKSICQYFKKFSR